MTDSSSERPHHRTTTSELFVCFPSRLSHSSMKISSKSILSPAHARDPPASAASATLSASLSRRLKTNRSLRGGQSPMFPSGGKKRGCAFENPEPSSPKVTCIGQVRVKTRKKQGKNLRTFSKRRGGEVSFRRVDHIQSTHVQQQQECLGHKNQSWVHLPLTICETLRSVGAEFSCLFPCRPSCFSADEREKEEKSNGRSGQSSCGAVFARWFVALQDGEEEGKRREIELVVGGEEEKSFRGMRERGLSRHVMEEIEMEVKEEKFDDEEGRVSICVPPKNALLLMRCRSDPMRMSALANRLVECPVPTGEEDEDEHEIVGEGKLLKCDDSRLIEESEIEASEKLDLTVTEEEEEEAVNPQPEAEHNAAMEVKETEAKENQVEEELDVSGEIAEVEEEEFEEDQEAGGKELNGFSTGDVEKAEDLVNEAALLIPERLEEEEADEERRISHYSSSSVISLHLDVAEREVDAEVLAEEPTLEESEKQKTEEEVDEDEEEDEEEEEEEDSSESEQIQKGEVVIESEKRETTEPVLPDCLLLMRCEPKLSMEVSKETWVCSTDFVRWLPRRQPKVKKIDGDDEPKKRISMDSNPAQQPPRSSCSLPAQAPAPASMATMIEQRLMSAVAYEPFVLTRCKSEPMRTAAAKLVPETCFWKNRKLENRSATFGFGAAGVGF